MVNIYGRTYRLDVELVKVEKVKEAAQMFNSYIEKNQMSLGVTDRADLVSLVALMLSVDMLSLTERTLKIDTLEKQKDKLVEEIKQSKRERNTTS